MKSAVSVSILLMSVATSTLAFAPITPPSCATRQASVITKLKGDIGGKASKVSQAVQDKTNEVAQELGEKSEFIGEVVQEKSELFGKTIDKEVGQAKEDAKGLYDKSTEMMGDAKDFMVDMTREARVDAKDTVDDAYAAARKKLDEAAS